MSSSGYGRPWWIVFAVIVAVMAGLSLGASNFGLLSVLRVGLDAIGLAEARNAAKVIVVEVRLPRVMLGLLVGSGLAVSGALMQAIFRNPLAEPTLIGVSSGAALGVAGAIIFGIHLYFPDEARPLVLPLFASLGGALTTLLVQRLATMNGQMATATLLLAGLALTSLINALLGLSLYVANDAQLRTLTFWLLGSLGGTPLWQVLIAAPIMVGPLLLSLRLAPALDVLLLGEAEAHHLGVDVERLKRRVIVLAAISVGTAVALSGVIGFVGLLVPHLMRLTYGPGHRSLLPRAALGGGGLLVAADVIARTAFAPAELPIGVLTALLGAPFFLWLLLTRRV